MNFATEGEALAAPFAARQLLSSPNARRPAPTATLYPDLWREAHACAAPPEATYAMIWGDGSASLLAALSSFAAKAIKVVGTHAQLHVNAQQPGLEVIRWRHLSLAFPPDLLLAAAVGSRPGAGPHRVDLAGSLQVGLNHAWAHLHTHLRAAQPFDDVVNQLFKRPTLPEVQEATPDAYATAEWQWLLAHWAVLRRALAATRGVAESKLTQVLRREFGQAYPRVRSALDRISAGHVGANRLTASGLWRIAHRGPRAQRQPREGELLRAHLTATGPRQIWTEQMCRLHVTLYRHLVLQPAQSGLRAFDEKFRRLGVYRKQAGKFECPGPQLAALQDEQPIDLQALEVRVSPRDSARGNIKLMVALAKNRGQLAEFGVTFHLIRSTPDDNRASAPFRARMRRLMSDAQRLKIAVCSRPDAFDSLTGFDLAGLESEGPLWQALPAVTSLLECGRKLSARRGLPPPILTLHAGEDFCDLLSGLRAIDEPIRWGLIGRRDRLGHALALGMDVDAWLANHRTTIVPRLQRLLDLLWVLDALVALRPFLPPVPTIDAASLATIEAEIRALAPPIFGPAVTLAELRSLYGQMSSPKRLRQAGTHRGPGLLARLVNLSGKRLARAREPVEVVPIPALYEALHQALLQVVCDRDIPIELNPTSNLVIGRLGGPLGQPRFHFLPTVETGELVPRVTINADDNLCFATRLADEVAYAYAGLVHLGGRTPAYAREWIDLAARNAWSSRATQRARA